jgi:pyridoxal phosphate enzyme (YggS family)
MTDLSHIHANIDRIRSEINAAALNAGRDPNDVKLIAVTKTYPAEAVAAAVHAGISDAGENRVQEAVPKIQAISNDLSLSPLRWHLIGHLQSNKARLAVDNFDMIHSVDSERLAREINKHAEAAGKLMSILIQINVSGEESKGGLPPGDAEGTIKGILEGCPWVSVHGFMTMAPLDAPEKARPVFKGLRELRDHLAKGISHPRFAPVELSMGMSNDYLVAIEEGATMLRIGTAIFVRRDYA